MTVPVKPAVKTIGSRNLDPCYSAGFGKLVQVAVNCSAAYFAVGCAHVKKNLVGGAGKM